MTDIAERRKVLAAAAKAAVLEAGRRRGEIVEIETQIARAEQDVALGRWYWIRRRLRAGRRRRRQRVDGPLVSVITPVFDTDPAQLGECLASVAGQSYAAWEHVLVDDGSRRADVRGVLDAAATDARRRIVRRAANGGIVAASNDAVDAASGHYLALLDHDDVLLPDALARLVAALEAAPEAPFAYSDNALLRSDGRPAEPFFKPDFSPERLRNHNYVLHCVVARAAAVRAVGGFRTGFDGAQDHDLLLRLSELGEPVHVAEVLYLWREAASSVAADPNAKPYAYDAGVRAVQDHCDRVGIAATVSRGAYDGVYRLTRRRPAGSVTAIVPTIGARRRVWGADRVLVVDAVTSLLDGSSHTDLDVVVVASPGTPDDVVDRLAAIGKRVRVVAIDAAFNFSASCNLGALHARGERLLFLNDDTELIAATSVDEMAALLAQPDIGMVGAKLLYEDGRLQHAGHVYPGLCTHALLGYPGDHPGPYRMAVVERECSGVTAAAAMIRADTFHSIGGFDEQLPHNFNDVDLSLRLRQAGYRNVWTPHASWYHFESSSRDAATGSAERDLVLARWSAQIEHDPYFNPNLAPHRTDWLERAGGGWAPPCYRDAAGRLRYS